jgi:hypothetical protein
MKRQLNYGFIFLLVGGFLLTTCHKDQFEMDRLSTEIELEPSIVAPLIYGSFDMSDLVEVMDSADYTLEDEDGVPFYLVYTDTIFSVDDTVGFDSGLEDDMVTYLQVSLKTVNEMPLEMDLQIYLEDANQVVLDSVFDNLGIVLEPSQVDSDGKLIAATEDENSSTFDAEKIGILDDVAYLRVKSKMQAVKEGVAFVKIYAAYSLDFELSISANARINTQD